MRPRSRAQARRLTRGAESKLHAGRCFFSQDLPPQPGMPLARRERYLQVPGVRSTGFRHGEAFAIKKERVFTLFSFRL